MPGLLETHKQPVQALPTDAADCHMHVFGPCDRYPLAPTRSYNAPEAPLAAHERMKRSVGLARTVLVTAVGHAETLPYRPLNAGELLDGLIAAAPDLRTREAILSFNPARLYQFA